MIFVIGGAIYLDGEVKIINKGYYFYKDKPNNCNNPIIWT
jgi:hypothetical protein